MGQVFENEGGKYKIATILQEYKFSLYKAQFFPSIITVQTQLLIAFTVKLHEVFIFLVMRWKLEVKIRTRSQTCSRI